MIWLAVVLASIGCYALKVGGMSVPRRALENPVVVRIATFLPVAMLAALVAVEIADGGGRLVFDPHLVAGVGAGMVALLLRRSILVVIVTAAVTTAVLRALL